MYDGEYEKSGMFEDDKYKNSETFERALVNYHDSPIAREFRAEEERIRKSRARRIARATKAYLKTQKREQKAEVTRLGQLKKEPQIKDAKNYEWLRSQGSIGGWARFAPSEPGVGLPRPTKTPSLKRKVDSEKVIALHTENIRQQFINQQRENNKGQSRTR
jgi:hypothetical protein